MSNKSRAVTYTHTTPVVKKEKNLMYNTGQTRHFMRRYTAYNTLERPSSRIPPDNFYEIIKLSRGPWTIMKSCVHFCMYTAISFSLVAPLLAHSPLYQRQRAFAQYASLENTLDTTHGERVQEEEKNAAAQGRERETPLAPCDDVDVKGQARVYVYYIRGQHAGFNSGEC